MPDFHIRTDCRLCSGPIEKVLDIGSTCLANELKSTREESLAQDKFPLFLSQCKACGHVQLPVVVKPERLFPPDYPYKSGTSPVFREHLKEFARTVSAGLQPGAWVLEVASNDGTLQREFEALGRRTLGIDPAAPPIGHKGTLASWCEPFSAALVPKVERLWGHPSAIVALNVFAHVDDLNDLTAGVAALLPDDGLFVFEVGYLPDVIERGLFDVCYHEHLSYHALRPLVPFFRKYGLELVDAHRVDSQGGSVRGFVRKKSQNSWLRDAGRQSYRLQGLLAAEEGLSVDKLTAKLDWLRGWFGPWSSAPPHNVAGFGAPAKLTTLLAATGLAPRVVYDDNPAKVGRYTPGTGIPIRPSAELLADNPDYLILFSWNFADELVPRLRALGYRGKIVVPLPEFKVLE